MKEVSAQEAFEKIKSGEALGIDVREAMEWQAGRADLENVIFNPLSAFDTQKIPQEKPIIFICRSGNRSGQVTEQLETYGLDVANMVGGMQAWEAAGLPMSADNDSPYVA
jgi:rhodanese-related sulfurtransferase